MFVTADISLRGEKYAIVGKLYSLVCNITRQPMFSLGFFNETEDGNLGLVRSFRLGNCRNYKRQCEPYNCSCKRSEDEGFEYEIRFTILVFSSHHLSSWLCMTNDEASAFLTIKIAG